MNKMFKLIFYVLFFCSYVNIISIDNLSNWHSTYLQSRFTEKINREEIKTIIELGAHHGLDAIQLHLYYQCPVFTFECDPSYFENIKINIAPYPFVTLVPYGVWHESKLMTFYQTKLPGSSSFYEFDFENLARMKKMTVEELIQLNKQRGYAMTPIQVTAVRLDEWMQEVGLEKVDLLCIDIQGATLNSLRGLGKYLDYVKYIITEVEYTHYYKNEPLFPEIKDFLKNKGFKCFFGDGTGFSDVLFVREGF